MKHNTCKASFRSGVALGNLQDTMSSAWMTVLIAAMSVGHGVAQDMSPQSPAEAKCVELNQMVMTHVANGRIADAEKAALSAALMSGADRWADTCAAVVLGNMAAVVSYSGRLAEGEKLAARSVAILERLHSPEHPVLLRPLQILAAARFDQGKRGKARETIKRAQSIRVERHEDIALVHAMNASLLHAGHRSEAEIEYRAALTAWEKAGMGDSADAAGALTSLASLYTDERRFHDARRALEHALAILTQATDALPMDRVKLLHARGILHARLDEWREAEQDLKDALTIADRESRADPIALRSVLITYAEALRKNHHGQEARAIEVRAAVLRGRRGAGAVVDLTELLPKSKR